MIPSLEILIPKSLNEALSILAEQNNGSKIIAGGTDVVPGLQQGSNRFANSDLLIDINRIPEIKSITRTREKISIGGAETFSNILQNQIVQEELPLLWKACSTIGSVQIRNRATIAGNFVNNAPCADTVPALLVYNATVEIESLNSKKEISIGEFLTGPYKTKLNKDEIVTRINVSIPSKEYEGEFYKLGRRRAVAVSRITLAVLTKTQNHMIDEIRIASGAVTPIGIRFFDLEKFAKGKKIEDQFLKELSKMLGEQIIQVTGLRWSSEYKLPVVQQMFYQLLKGIERGSL
ncbi:MAG: xanthine dehydrogenase family protein subunit M [Bacteroidetes bacterium]|nr:xanthine dehydrogenase family protein subunit M [Bacteroidota bacterium]